MVPDEDGRRTMQTVRVAAGLSGVFAVTVVLLVSQIASGLPFVVIA